MSSTVGDVIGEFEFVKGNGGPGHPVFSGGGRVRVGDPFLVDLRVCLARDHPPRVVEFVPVVVGRRDVHKKAILGLLVQARNTVFEAGKHPPEHKLLILAIIKCIGTGPTVNPSIC